MQLSSLSVRALLLVGAMSMAPALNITPKLYAAAPQQSETRRPARKSTTPAKKPAPAKPALRYTTPRGVAALSSDLGAILASRTRSGSWGAMVISLSRGDTLFAVNPDKPYVPASTMKLFTTALALDRLGAEHTFSTDVLRDGLMDKDGVVHGNLIIRGDGDPALSQRFVHGGPSAPMDMLAGLTSSAGVTKVTGDLIADASAFESRNIPEGWLTRYAGSAYAAPFSALSLNENIVVVSITPGETGGDATVALEPATRGMTVTNTVRTVAGTGVRVSSRRVSDDKVIVSGTIGNRAGQRRYQLVVGDPVTFTAGAYRAALEAKGITIGGNIRVGPTTPQATIVSSMPSPPLSRLVSLMNRESINHYAEMLWRDAARGPQRNLVGSAQTADSTLQQFLMKQVGVTPGAVVATDGSGLSVLDRVTPRAMVQLLSHANTASWSSAFHASLPVAGESELLRHRMKSTPAQGNLHAKTGTTNAVIGLAGYVTAENGEIMAFSFLYNGTDRFNARETIDAMGPTMAGFWRE